MRLGCWNRPGAFGGGVFASRTFCDAASRDVGSTASGVRQRPSGTSLELVLGDRVRGRHDERGRPPYNANR